MGVEEAVFTVQGGGDWLIRCSGEDPSESRSSVSVSLRAARFLCLSVHAYCEYMHTKAVMLHLHASVNAYPYTYVQV